MQKKLYRSRTRRVIAGVCGGIAEYFNVDETLVRLAMTFIALATGVIPGLLFYFVAAIIVPENPEPR